MNITFKTGLILVLVIAAGIVLGNLAQDQIDKAM